MNKFLTVCYAITPARQGQAGAADKYQRLALQSIASVLRHNPDITVHLAQCPGGDYPWGVKPKALPERAMGWVLFLDADTVVHGDLGRLMVEPAEFNARVGSAWPGHIDQARWKLLTARFGLEARPLYNAGAFLCSASLASALRKLWGLWMFRIRHAGCEDPLRLPRRPPWWMLDQFALACALADLRIRVGRWTRRQHSYGWKGEPPGLIEHLGGKQIRRILSAETAECAKRKTT